MAHNEPAYPEGLVERYEELRRRALAGECDGWRIGLAVLQHKGIAAWIHAWDDIRPPRDNGRGSPPPPAAHCEELVSVLACMALSAAGG